jgi:hypothetical protein
MSLTLDKTSAILTHINARKEGPSDEKTLAIDIKFAAQCTAEHLAYFGDTLRHFLFDGEGNVRMPNLDTVKLKGEMRHMCLMVNEGIVIEDAKLDKFKVDAQDGERVELGFTAHFTPAGRQVAMLAELLGESVTIIVLPQAELPLGQPS